VIRCDTEFDVMMLFESDAIECLYLFWNVGLNSKNGLNFKNWLNFEICLDLENGLNDEQNSVSQKLAEF
jgi:hypothetical protein